MIDALEAHVEVVSFVCVIYLHVGIKGLHFQGLACETQCDKAPCTNQLLGRQYDGLQGCSAWCPIVLLCFVGADRRQFILRVIAYRILSLKPGLVLSWITYSNYPCASNTLRAECPRPELSPLSSTENVYQRTCPGDKDCIKQQVGEGISVRPEETPQRFRGT